VTATIYDVGDVARIEAPFRDVDNQPADPTTVTASIRKPDGTVTDYTVSLGEIVRDGVGLYHLDVAVDMAGDWFYRFAGTGTVSVADEKTFVAREPLTSLLGPLDANALTTLGETREYVLRDATDDSQDRKLITLINAYSRAVEKYTRREWLPITLAATRSFHYDGAGFMSMEPYDLRSATEVVANTQYPAGYQEILIAGTPTVVGNYWPKPAGATAEGTYWWLELPTYRQTGSYEVSVTGDWGIGTVPSDVELALWIAIDDAYKNPTGFAGGEVGGLGFAEIAETSLEPDNRARNLPIESRSLLAPYRRST